MKAQPRIAQIARWHVMFGLTFAVLGMALGIYMASSQNHGQHVTHAHTLLLGFVVSVLYGAIYRLWLGEATAKLAIVQTALHEVGATLIVMGLFLLFSGRATEAALAPLLGTGSTCAITGAVLMVYQMLRVGQTQQAASPEALARGEV